MINESDGQTKAPDCEGRTVRDASEENGGGSFKYLIRFRWKFSAVFQTLEIS